MLTGDGLALFIILLHHIQGDIILAYYIVMDSLDREQSSEITVGYPAYCTDILEKTRK